MALRGSSRARLLALLCVGASSCSVPTSESIGSTESTGEAITSLGSTTPVFTTLSDDSATSVSVKNGMTLTLHAALTFKMGSLGETLILKGSTSQELTFVQGFIPDDAFGTATQLGPKSFQLLFDNPSDINTVISGEPFYLELTTHSTTLGDTSWSAQILVAPRLVPTAVTTSRLALGTAIQPTVVTTNPEGVVFRGTATTTAVPKWLTVTADSNPTLVEDAAHAWHFDWDFSHFESAAAGKTVEAQAKFGSVTSTRDSDIAIRVATVGLAVGTSADDIYGFPVCPDAVLACLKTLPATTTDFGACGAYLGVRVCIDTVGFPVP